MKTEIKIPVDEDMDQLVESIKERGIITPVTLRQKPDGRYEIVSGHRRTKACELAGLATVKAEIKELSRDEATILMVESNLQRATILPSEKAFSYKMRLEAMNRQGTANRLNLWTSGPQVRRNQIERCYCRIYGRKCKTSVSLHPSHPPYSASAGLGGLWKNRFPARRGAFLPDRERTKQLAGFHQFRAVHPVLGAGSEDERIFPEWQAQRRRDPLHHV